MCIEYIHIYQDADLYTVDCKYTIISCVRFIPYETKIDKMLDIQLYISQYYNQCSELLNELPFIAPSPKGVYFI